jgi:hypothetical protein
MKKALALILLLMYFVVSTGFVVSFHYCMDKLDSVQIGAGNDEECGKCGMHTGKNACCFDDVKMVKLDATHTATAALIASFSLPEAVAFTSEYLLAPFYNLVEEDFVIVHSPPLIKERTYLYNCVFRI